MMASGLSRGLTRRRIRPGIGSDQVRGVRFEGERMVLIPPPRLTGESEEHREITWERIAAE
jgi:hypothetical protein